MTPPQLDDVKQRLNQMMETLAATDEPTNPLTFILLAESLLEAVEALEKSCWCGAMEPGETCEACDAIAKIQAKIGGG